MFPLLGKIAAAMVVLTVAAGCTREDPVTAYSVPKRDLMAVAMVSDGNTTWFFKLTGRKLAVDPHLDEFTEFVKSVDLRGEENPTWKLPPDWKERGNSGISFATIQMGKQEPPLEIAVTPLPENNPASEESLLANYNRWRGQLGLPPVSGDDWLEQAKERGEIRTIEVDGREATLVTLLGNQPMMPRFAVPQQVSYSTPEGWTEVASDALRLAVFHVPGSASQSTGEAAEVSISTAGGTEEANIARWQGQLGISPGDEDATSEEEMEIDGRRAKWVRLVGQDETILGVIVKDGGRNWFIKFRGPNDVVENQAETFREFAKSLSWED